jgi:Tol biopolymer transport system component
VDDRIALVSTDSGNDEIFVINADGSELRRLTNNSWEWDKHPTWSPDGRNILFYSNRDTGRRQLWMMKADGSEQRIVTNSQFNDWDPIWIK